MAEGQGYIGRAPGDSSVIIASQTFEPTGIQTNFTFASGYDPGYIDVYLNGARLIYANDYTATNGSTVALVEAATNGDVLECVAYKAFNVAQVSSSSGNFTVGQDLTVTGFTTGGSAYYSGIVTATSFSGDGSGLTGVASTDNIITGVAVTIGGILRVTDTTQSTSSTTGAVIVSGGVGIAKSLNVGGNVTVGGTLTYEDVTNQDVIGLATFRSGVQFGVAGVGGTITGVGNATIVGILTVGGVLNAGDDIDIPDTKAIKLGDGDDLWLWHDTSNHSIIRNATGDLRLQSDSITLKNYEGTHNYLTGTENGAVDIYYSNSKKLETTGYGLTISGGACISGVTTALGGLVVSGVSTLSGNSFVGSAITMYASSGIVSATAFYGDGSQLEGVSASGGGALDITSCLFI